MIADFACNTADSRTNRLDDADEITATRKLFIGLCVYLATQVFLIPILPIGPWAIWPRLADFATVAILVLWIVAPKTSDATTVPGRLFARGVLFVALFAVVNFIGLTLLLNNLTALEQFSNSGLRYGSYGVYRMIQFGMLCFIVARIPIDFFRAQRLASVTELVLIVSCLGCMLSFVSVITPQMLTAWLPVSTEAGGAWFAFQRRAGQGLGAIGYNHGYVATQLLVLLALALQLDRTITPKRSSLLIGLTGIAILLSGSRSGFLSFAIYIAAFVWWRSGRERFVVLYSALVMVGLLLVANVQPSPEAATEAELIVQRQLTAFQPTAEENLSGRPDIWESAVSRIGAGSVRSLILGLGLGEGIIGDSGAAAHMLPLHYLLEFGLVGLFILVLCFYWLLRFLARSSGENKSMLWATIALLIGSLSQETFYPIAWTGHFLAMFFVAIVVSVNARSYEAAVNSKRSSQ